jgi:hypothetical protein
MSCLLRIVNAPVGRDAPKTSRSSNSRKRSIQVDNWHFALWQLLLDSVVNADVVLFQHRSNGAIQGKPRFDISATGGHFRGAGLGDKALDLEIGLEIGKSKSLPLINTDKH